MENLYRDMLNAEQQHSSARDAMDAGQTILDQYVAQSGKSYDELVIAFEK